MLERTNYREQRNESARNRRLLRSSFEALDAGDLGRLDDLVREDFVGHRFAGSRELRSRAELKAFLADSLAAFEGARCDVRHLVAESDLVVAHAEFTGRHVGELDGTAPTGREVSMSMLLLARVADGRIGEAWVNADVLGLLTQLGVVPEPGPEREPA